MATFVDKIKEFNDGCESFLNEMQHETNSEKIKELTQDIFNKLHNIRKAIIVQEENQSIFISEKEEDLDVFIIKLINSFDGFNIVISVEILRIFNRLSQVYSTFLNDQNKIVLVNYMKQKILQNDDPLIKHYAIISTGKVIRQSKSWAQILLPLFPFILDNIDLLFDESTYFANLKRNYFNEIESLLEDVPCRFFNVNAKHGNPYFYALRGYTKNLSYSDFQSNQIIKIFEEIFQYFDNFQVEISSTNYFTLIKIEDIFSAINVIKILNDILKYDDPFILKLLKSNGFSLNKLMDKLIPFCDKCNFLPIIKELSILINLLCNYGEEFKYLFENHNLRFLCEYLFIDNIGLSISVSDCMFSIISLFKENGLYMIFNNSKDINNVIELAMNENLPDQKKVSILKLVGIMFRFWTESSFDFDVNSFIKNAIDYINIKNDQIAMNAIYALNNLFLKMKSMGIEEKFISSFINNNGKAAVESLINQNGDLSDLPKNFLNNLNCIE